MAQLPCRSQGKPGHVAASSWHLYIPWSLRLGPMEQGCIPTSAAKQNMPSLSCTNGSCVPTLHKLHIQHSGNSVNQAASLHSWTRWKFCDTHVTCVRAKAETEGRTPEMCNFQKTRKGPARSCCWVSCSRWTSCHSSACGGL